MAVQKTNDGGRLENSSENGRGDTDSRKRRAEWPVPGISSEALAQAAKEKNTELRKTFGRNLARIRKRVGYSQLSLATELEMSHNFINELEQGDKGASFQTIAKLSIILRTPAQSFFEQLENQPAPEDFRYSESVDELKLNLYETIDTWYSKRVK
jgi:transcriptional regulator with XRE-family HTH domain